MAAYDAAPKGDGIRMSSGTEQLARTRGYRVETHDGRIGSVLAVLPRVGCELPGLLLVQTGLPSRRVAAIPFGEIETVDLAKRRVLLRGDPETMQEGAPPGAGDRIVTRT